MQLEYLFEPKTSEPEGKKSEPLDLSECSIESLSQKLSDVLRNPETPQPLFQGIQDGLTNLFNDVDSDTKDDVGSSPNYISSLIKGFKRTEGDNE